MLKQPSLYNSDHIAEALCSNNHLCIILTILQKPEALILFKQPSLYNIDHIAEALCSSNHLCIILTILQKPYVQAAISV